MIDRSDETTGLKQQQRGLLFIVIVGIVTLSLLFLSPPIPQDNRYHSFSDQDTYLTVPNALNVLSNLPFLLVGIIGIVAIRRSTKYRLAIVKANYASYMLLFYGTAFVSFGSAYYHLQPNNSTLLWDRLPMTLAFMSLYSVIISEFVSEELGRKTLLPLIGMGALSVLYWWHTESQGEGDLRFYAVVQFFPILTIPIFLLCFKSTFTHNSGYWGLLATYILAKIFEHFDHQVHLLLGIVSGHTIKHLLPALGLLYLLRSYRLRERVVN